MIISIDWLKEFCQVSESIQDVARRFYDLGFSVEKIDAKNHLIDLEITPNRGDALSILGLAREYCASTHQNLKYYIDPITNLYPDKFYQARNNTNQIINYSFAVISGIKITKSSEIIAKRLKEYSINSINNVIDITNYLMIENGHPLHAFDADLINGNIISFENSKSGDEIQTLDEKKYSIPQNSIIAKDSNSIIDLVGIQGGLNSGVNNKTTKILIHSINIFPSIIRKTSKLIGHSTPASYRFERGVDPAFATLALSKAIELILKECGGKVEQINLTVNNLPKLKRAQISYNFNEVDKLIGTEITTGEQKNILESLGFKLIKGFVQVPSFRSFDIFSPVDITEEIIRLFGYNKLKKEAPNSTTTKKLKTDAIWDAQRKLANKLIELGFSEILTYSFLSSKQTIPYSENELLELANPLSQENKYLRPSLIPNLVATAEKNTWQNDIKVFEIGNVFTKSYEKTNIALLSTSQIGFLENCRIIEKASPPHNTRRKYYYYESSINELANLVPDNIEFITVNSNNKYINISKYPPLVRDISIIVDTEYSIEEIKKTIESFEKVLIADIFDVFESDKFGQNKKSLAFRIIFDDVTQTLTADKTSIIIDNIVSFLSKEYNAILR